MGSRVVGTGGAVAKVPHKVVIDEIDVGFKSNVSRNAIGDGVIGVDDLFVDCNGGRQVGGFRSYHIGITRCLTKTIDMGIEASFT